MHGNRHNLSAAGRLLGPAGSVWVGVFLIALIVAYLALASLPPCAESLAKLLRTLPADLYGHWVLAGLAGLLCLNMVVATVTRIRLDLPRAGAWSAHLGVILLAGGTAWYAAGRARGYCVAGLTRTGWTPIREFYTAGTFALTVEDDAGAAVQVALADLRRCDASGHSRKLNVPVPRAPGGAQVRVTEYSPHIALGHAVELEIAGPGRGATLRSSASLRSTSRRVLLSPDVPGNTQYDSGDYILLYRPDLPQGELAELVRPSEPNRPSGSHCDIGIILTGPEIPPLLVAIRPDGSREVRKLRVGAAAEVQLGGKEVTLRPIRFHFVAAGPSRARRAFRAVKVQIRAADWQAETWLPYTPFFLPDEGIHVLLPGGRSVRLHFTPRREPLGATLRVKQTDYQTYPASVVPRDYVTRLEIARGHEVKDARIRLNGPAQVGGYQVSHNNWLPDAGRPTTIIFDVASRPGIGLIWTGCALICLAMPWAFYVKPLLLRRRRAKW